MLRSLALFLLALLLVSVPTSAAGPDPLAERWLATIRVPPFTPPATWAAWEARRSEIRATLWSLLGDFPPRPKTPPVNILSRTDGDGYVLEKFAFDDGLGATVPGYIFLPKGRTGKRPAILYCHWHAGQYDVGKEEMLRTNATPVPPGPTLARRGYVVLGIDAQGFGERNGQGPGGPNERGAAAEESTAKFELLAGRTLWGMMLRDQLMALDYLCARPEVDPARVGVTGISMGCTASWWIMALDDRPRAAVCVDCLTRYQDLIAQDYLHVHGIYYFVPGVLRHFDTEAIIACGAPRAMLFLSGDRDHTSPPSGVRTIAAKVGAIYRLAGRESEFQTVIYPNTPHVYLPAMWERMVAWMDARLQP